jgi:hypothetical protein
VWGGAVMARAFIQAGLVFLFMAFLATQAATGFMRELFSGGVYPRAMQALDWVLETLLIGSLGPFGGAFVLLVFGLLMALLVWKKATIEEWK